MIYIGLAMFRGFGLDQVMAGNLREKSRATEAAQSAMQYAQWWLVQATNASNGVACTAGAKSKATICTGTPNANPLSDAYATYADSTKIPVSTTGGVGKYYASPVYTIYFAGMDTSSCARFYLITAKGYGGNQNAVATLQSVYRVIPGQIKDLGQDNTCN
ncbi:pilus assembly PilX family protein [Amantichitinum ursilacus]|nr:hypothetical protein [Amantichitinum ursilacus]